MKAKKEYEVFLKNGELLDIFPELSGSWKVDKKITLLWEQNQKAISDLDINFDEYE